MTRRARTLADLGESKLIARIARMASVTPSPDWPVAIGDDAAVLRPRKGQDLVISADALVEDVHFRFGRETPVAIGRRALAVNLSDLAAMGALPVGCLLSLSAPSDLGLSVFDGLLRGLLREARAVGCPLVGGNLSRASECALHVTVVGRVPRGRALRRGRLRPGDELFVTGVLGAAALARQRADRLGGRLTRVPEARLGAGLKLARSKATTACIDLSDGLAADLPHLLRGSGYGAEIDLASLPAARGFSKGCEALGLDPVELQLRGGEDYELLFARRPAGGRVRSVDALGLTAQLGVPVRRIGVVTAEAGLRGLSGPPAVHHF